ncbi:MAG: hemolysin III family protein, partial [Syntrophomonadaceae bacterium]|nr:hemolysin III family protein [Syntrophomonadaceae bacterium]
WGLAAVGVAMKLFWFNAPRWFSTLFYVFMGVIVVTFLPLLSGMLSLAAVAWIAGGGILYIVGAIIYAAKPSLLNFSKWFGFHEVFHLFVLGGSFCHFWFIYRYVLA